MKPLKPVSPEPRRLTRRSALCFLGTAATVVAAATSPAARAATPAVPRVETLLARLTLDEKLTFLHGGTDPAPLGQAGYIPGVPRLRIPPLRLADGPAGVRVTAHATALPAPVALASTFDPPSARAYGEVIGREGRALGQDVLLSPMVNLIRTPYAGRNFETFSEDPLLASDLVAAEVRGIQSQGLIATVKHFAMNNQEHERQTMNVVVDEQTMHETELRGFESAVAAGAGAVMGAYNKVNGTFACENKTLLTGILRDRWGFDGWVMTDWYAAHSTVAAISAGLDMEMPDDTYFGAALKAAVQDGSVPEALVDRSVRRVLTVMERHGLLDRTLPPRPARDPQAGARVAYDVAVRGAVLLRNEHATLPLTGARASGIAVIGPTGQVPFVSGGGSAHVVPDRATSPLAAITARAGGPVTYALGEDLWGKEIPEAPLDEKVDPGATFSHEAVLRVAEEEEWTLLVHYTSANEDRPKVTLDGTELFPLLLGPGEFFVGGLLPTAPDGLAVRHKAVRLTAGEHRLTVTAEGGTAGQHFRLRRITPATRAADVTQAVAAARKARTAVVFAYEDATEGQDRTTIALPGNQNALIEAVARANPRTVVVLNTSSSVAMPWLRRTPAVLQMWYPGQQGAEATTALLFGDANPGGRLSQTFPVSDSAHPVAGDPLRYPGVAGQEHYSEGVETGYRWYDARGVRPLFPFGHGLSYTTFAYSGLRVAGDGDGALTATFTVRNTGRRTGAEVPQVYVGPSPDLKLPQPTRALVGYRRLELKPGESRRVAVRIPARLLSSWDPARDRWTPGTGQREVLIAASATDVRLKTRAHVR